MDNLGDYMTNNVENIEDVIRKVKKCLALANDKNDDESQTAMLLAQKMLAKHSLSMKDIDFDLEQPRNKNVLEGDGTRYTKLQWWMKSLSSIIAKNFRCYNITRSWNGKSKIVFIGLEDDVEICKSVYDFAMKSIKYHSERYLRASGVVGDRTYVQSIKNDYISGYLNGLNDKFREQVEKNNWGLVLVTDALVVQHINNMNLKKGRALNVNMKGDSVARQRGYTDGKNFEHGNKQIRG